MITEKIGVAKIRLKGDRRYKLLSELLCEGISIKEMTDGGECISGSVELGKLKRLKKLCDKFDVSLEVISETGLIVHGRKYYKHYGIALGLVVVIAVLSYLSNVILQIRIVGADAEARTEIMSILKEYDVDIGRFIPSIDLYQLETALMKESDLIAWAGIRSGGSELVVNISQVKQKPQITQIRMPASIVSSKDAVITGFQVYCGSVDFLIGDAVAKGQILISGEYQDKNGDTRYRYSQASIIGRYKETQKFFEPFESKEKVVTENVSSRKMLRFFSTDISLKDDISDGRYIEQREVKYLNFLGLQLPVGMTEIIYDSYEYVSIIRDEEQVKAMLMEDISKYEQNFMCNDKILDKNVSFIITEKGVYATVDYVAEGEIGETKLIIRKNK